MRRGDGLVAGVIGAAGCVLAAAPVACFLLLQPVANAEPVEMSYGMGVAPGGTLGGDLARKLDTSEHAAGRLFLGLRRDWLGIEVSLAGTDADVVGEDAEVSTFALAIEARPALAITKSFSVYLHGGPSYGWIGYTDHPLGQFSGLGLVYGLGFELSTRRQLETGWLLGGSFWAEECVQHLDLAGPDGGALRGTVALTLLGLGFSFGH